MAWRLKEEKKDVRNIFNLLKKRDFSSYTGLAIKNSVLQTTTLIISKIGSLVFTVIIARLLLPELFGLYSLALSTIILLSTFTDLGTSQTLVRYVSLSLSKKNKGIAKGYLIYLTKIKLILTFLSIFILLALAKFISNSYYHKPIFLALIAGSIYILSNSIISFIDSIFQSSNNFKSSLYKEIFLQLIRLIIVPIIIIFSLKKPISIETDLFFIIMSLSLCYLFTMIFFYFLAKKKILFIKSNSKNITKKKKREMNKFLLSISALVLSGVFFGYIDMVMLGRFVSGEFIGYYQAAFGLVGAAAPLITFSAVLFPIFSRINREKLNRAFDKSFKIIFSLSILSLLFTFIFAPLIIKMIYGSEYSTSIPLLRLFSLLFISLSLISHYSTYLIVKGKQNIVIKLLIISTILNVILNYVFIIWLLSYSQFMAVVGAIIATIISRYFYLFALMSYNKKYS